MLEGYKAGKPEGLKTGKFESDQARKLPSLPASQLLAFRPMTYELFA
jgi:hypothetical protein